MAASNIDQVTAWLDAFVDPSNFTRPGTDQSLGRDVAWKVVEQIEDRAQKDKRGTGDDWDPNAPDMPRGKRSGTASSIARTRERARCSSTESLYGRTTIEPEQVTMIYGLNEPPTCTKTAPRSNGSRQESHRRQKAYFAHTGQGPGKDQAAIL